MGNECEPQKTVIVKQKDVKQVKTVLSEETYGFKFLASDLFISAPFAPSNLSVTAVRETEVDLNWDDNPKPVDSYTVYVYNQTTSILEQTITGISLSEASAFGLTTDDTYEFWVTAVKDGIESKESNHVTATPIDTTAPAAPTNLTATAGDTVVDLNWDDNTESDLAGYNMYVDDGTGFVKHNTSLVGPSNYQVDGLTNSTTYSFKVTAVDTSGNESADSNIVSATPQGTVTAHLLFNGTDQYVNAGVLGIFGSQMANPFCIEFRFSSTSTAYSDFMGVIHNISGTVRRVLEVHHNREGDTFPVVDKTQLFIFDDTRTGSSGSLVAYNTNVDAKLTDGVAHRLSFNCDPINDTVEIFIDGVSLGVTYYLNTDIVDFSDFVQAFVFGARNNQGTIDFFYNGKMDDIRLWTKNRTQAEIQGDMDSELDAPNGYATDYPDLFRYYKCNDATGDVLTEEVVADHASLVGNVGDNMWGTGNL